MHELGVLKCEFFQNGQTVRRAKLRQPRIAERAAFDPFQTVGQGDPCERGKTVKRAAADAPQRRGQGHGGDVVKFGERLRADCGDPFADDDRGGVIALVPPRRELRGAVVRYGTRAGDGEHTVFKRPVDAADRIVASCAADRVGRAVAGRRALRRFLRWHLLRQRCGDADLLRLLGGKAGLRRKQRRDKRKAEQQRNDFFHCGSLP